jgi:O-succinylbenzoic acid--CoA ligase
MEATLIIGQERLSDKTLIEWSSKNQEVDWQNQIAEFVRRWFDSNDFMEVKTSGSTGTPKLIRLSKSSMKESARLTARTFNLQAGDNALLCLPCQYIAGQMMIVRALVNGWNLYCTEPNSRPLQHIDARLNFTAMIPLQMEQSLTLDPHKTSEIKTIILGGAPVSNKLRNQISHLPNDIFLTYGMTETITHVAIEDLKKDERTFSALEGVHFETDTRDCLVINAQHLDVKKVVTNDVIELIDTQHFRWLGRFDDVINSGGIKLHPAMLERKLSDVLTLPFYFTQKQDELLGQALVLVIEGVENELSEDELSSLFADRLDKFEVPKAIVWKPGFRRTQTGKVIREL